jgi:serine/threonine-protein kinase
MAPGNATNPIARGRAGSLGRRIFLLSATLIAASVSTAVVFTALRARQVANEAVGRALDASQSAQESFDSQREKQLRLISRIVASDPSFVAYVAEADPASIRDLLEQRRQALGCDFAIVLDRAGRVLARTDRPGGIGDDLSRLPLVAAAIERGEASDVWREEERLSSAVAVALLSGQQVVEGVLVAGFALDPALAVLLKRATDADVAFLAFDAGATRVAASTLGASAEALVQALGGALGKARAGEVVPRYDLRLDGHAWVARVRPLRDASGAPVGAVAILAPLDRHLSAFRSIAWALVVAGAIGVAVAFALSYTLSRRVTRPIERLATIAEAARAGDFTAELPTGGSDEVGRLGRAFHGLLSELRDQRELEQYLSQLSRHIPDPATEERPVVDIGLPLARGATLGDRFEVLSLLGTGAAGAVYRARDRALKDVVALKVLRRDVVRDPRALEGLKEELRLARRVTHRHVLRTHDFGELDQTAFISMEYVRGVTLRQLLEQSGPLPIAVALRIARQVLAGLEAAHAMDVLHGDLKPENLLLEPNGNAKLADFGVARLLRRGRPATEQAVFTGTPHYMAPEQLQGHETDKRSDLYAVGVVMFEMLTGRRPFVAADATELFYVQTNQDPPGPRSFRGEISVSLDALVLACLARDPAARPASAAELRESLRRLDPRGVAG